MDRQSAAAPEESALEKIEYGSGPSILLFSDDSDQRDAIGTAISAAGGRISAALGLGEAVDRIADHAAPDGVFVDIRAATEAQAEHILDTIEEGARSQRFRSIALISPDRIDLAAARAGHRNVQLLCDPDDAAIADAIAELLVQPSLELNDISADSHPAKLRQLSEEASRLARTLAALSSRQAEGSGLFRGGIDDGDAAEPAIEAPTVRAIIRARRLRGQFLAKELFADPAWDMLLDLTAAQLEERAVSVSSLCIAAEVPATTALRWIRTLTDLGLFVRVADPRDRRKVYIQLSEPGFAAMLGYLAAMRRILRTA